MKAAVFYEHGGPEVLRVENVPRPRMRADGAIVAVRAAALNHLDVWVRRGLPGLKLRMPHIPCSDVAGIVVKTGAKVKGIKAGDRVVANPGISCGGCEFCRTGQESLCVDFKILGEHVPGTCAEFVGVPAENLYKMPESISFEVAAAAPLTFLTAWRMLVSKARVEKGQDVLIQGAGSGVSIAAIGIAKHLGARVFVASRNATKLRKAVSIGADVTINSSKKKFDEEVWRLTRRRGVDVVVDHVGPATWTQSLRSLTRGGKMVVCGATSGPSAEVNIRQLYWRQVSIIGSTMSSQKEFRDVMGLVAQGRLRPVIDTVLPVSEIREANAMLERGGQFGKIVIEPG